MPSTTELIDYMEYQAPGWNRIGANKSLIQVLDQTQNILYKQPMAQTIPYDADGQLPTIDTTGGTETYTLNQATTGLSVDIWRCESVLTRRQLPIEYGIGLEQARLIDTLRFNGIDYYKYFHVNCRDALHNGDPVLKFSVDPGTVSGEFYLLCYQKPTPLTGEGVTSDIPDHLHIPIFLQAALKLLEGYQNGNVLEAIGVLEKEFKPMIMKEMMNADQGRLTTVLRHEE